MKRIIIIFIFGLTSISVFSQQKSNKVKFDSIINEANLLYSYEKVTWNSSDLAYGNKKINDNIGTYLIHHSNDTIFAIFADKELKHQIAKYSYTQKNLKTPFAKDHDMKPLSDKALNLFKIKQVILNNLNSQAAEYGFNFQKGYNPNAILIPVDKGFKLYLIIGTVNSNVIPFGNDYLFKANEKGEITDWKRFHKTLIATQTRGPNGEIVISAIHSHLQMTPYITATDICTFRLYGVDLFGMEEFMISSTALNKIFKYNAKQNSITETDL